jgi:cytochrome b pre-mRNA-processing protein 3
LILQRLFKRKPNPTAALYDAIVAAARQPHFFANWGVPDTLDGRFDVIVLHLFLVLERLKSEPEITRRNLIDYFFLDMDRSLREMGVGDVSVGKKVRKMAEAFYGRLTAYADAVEKGNDVLVASLQRNIYAGEANVHAADLAVWVNAARSSLSTQSPEKILAAQVKFS